MSLESSSTFPGIPDSSRESSSKGFGDAFAVHSSLLTKEIFVAGNRFGYVADGNFVVGKLAPYIEHINRICN